MTKVQKNTYVYLCGEGSRKTRPAWNILITVSFIVMDKSTH